MVVVHCAYCGRRFEAERKSAKYCPDKTCKFRAHYQRQKNRARSLVLEISPQDEELFKLLEVVNPNAARMVVEIQDEHGKPAARRAIQLFGLLLDQGLVLTRPG